LILDGQIEDLSQALDGGVDRGGVDPGLAHLVGAVAVDLGDRDLAQPVLGEEGQKMVAELPFVVDERPRAQLVAAFVEPARGELVEGGIFRRGGWLLGIVGLPGPAADVGKDVLEFGLGSLSGPPVGA
jgi:hypothetical protein